MTSLPWPLVLSRRLSFRGNSSLAHRSPPSGRPPCRPRCSGRRPWAARPLGFVPHRSGSQVRAGQTDGQYGPMAESRLTQGVGGKGQGPQTRPLARPRRWRRGRAALGLLRAGQGKGEGGQKQPGEGVKKQTRVLDSRQKKPLEPNHFLDTQSFVRTIEIMFPRCSALRS